MTIENAAERSYDAVIIGGGIAGLSAAWYLERQAESLGKPVRYAVFERSARWGGKIRTDRVDVDGAGTFLVEAGPDSFLTQKPWALDLIRELGIEDRVLPTNDAQRKIYVWNKGRPTPLPGGMFLIMPTQILPFARSSLLSWPGKLRAGLDLFIPARRDDGDETLSDFLSRRMGREVLDKIGEPLLAGIYNSDPDCHSMMATFPRLRELERKYGSLVRAGRSMAKARNKRLAEAGPGAKPPPMFVSLRGGAQELVDTLVSRLSGELQLSSPVERISHVDNEYRVELAKGQALSAAHLILALPADAASQLIRGMASDAAGELAEFRYMSVGNLSLAYRKESCPTELDGFGLLMPRSEGRPVNAVTYTSTKFDNRAPQGAILLRVFLGGSRNPEVLEKSDEDVIQLVRDELRTLLGIEDEPLFNRLNRWPHSSPQYDVGHLERMARVESNLPQGVFLAGGSYGGVGVPDCVRQGKEAAERVMARTSEGVHA